MDKQNIDDIEFIVTSVANKKKQAITNLKFLIKKTVHFQSMKGYNDIWKTNSLIDLEQVQKPYLYDLIQIFNIAGQSKLTNMTKMKDGISESNVVITEAIIDEKKSTLSQKLTELGYKYNDDDVLNSSFADSLFAGSVVNDSLFDDDANNCLNINNDTADDGSDDGHYSVQSETSAGEHSSGSLIDDLDKSIENSRRVRFDEIPLFRSISPQASRNISTSASTSISRTNRQSNPSRSTQK